MHIFESALRVHIALLRLRWTNARQDSPDQNLLVLPPGALHLQDFRRRLGVEVRELVFVLFERMACDEEAENLLFISQPRVFIPIGGIRQPFNRARRLLLEHAKQPVLPGFRVALRFLRLLDRLIQRGHNLRPAAEPIHGAALYQRFQNALVEQTQINVLAKFKNRFELSQFLASSNNRINRVVSNVFHRRQTKSNRFPVRSEIRIAHVDVGRLNRNPHLATFVDVLHNIVRTAGHRR